METKYQNAFPLFSHNEINWNFQRLVSYILILIKFVLYQTYTKFNAYLTYFCEVLKFWSFLWIFNITLTIKSDFSLNLKSIDRG